MIYSLFYLSAGHLLFSSIFSITFLSNIICLPESAHPFSSPQTLFLIFFQRWTHTFSHPLIQSYQIAKMLLPPRFLTALSVPKVPIREQLRKISHYRTGGICLETKFCYHCSGNLRHCGALCQLVLPASEQPSGHGRECVGTFYPLGGFRCNRRRHDTGVPL